MAVERELARALAPACLPAERVAEIRAALQSDVTRARVVWPLGAVAALVMVPVLFAWGWRRTPVLVPAPGEASTFEQAALALHAGPLDPSDGATLVTASTAEARGWARTRTGVDLSLPLGRPPEDEGRFELAGVRAMDLHGTRAVAVSYRVDGRPVTLAAAHEADVRGEVPSWTTASKRVRAHEVAGHRVLSWANDGQAYVLVADLPGAGLRACLVCHTQPGRRRVIDQLGR